MSKLKSILKFVTRRRRAMDPELEQSILRVSIVSIMVIYLAARQFVDPTHGHAMALYSVACFLMFSFAIFAWVVAGPEDSRVRKIVGIVHDVGGLTCVMYFFGAATAPFYIAYLWVIFGNGFRFGIPYLALASGISAAGFAVVVAFNSYWSTHTTLGVGLLIGLIVLPAYVATLISRLSHAKQQAVEANQAKLNEGINKLKRKLENLNYVERAPKDVVQRDRDRVSELVTELERIEKHIDEVKALARG